MDGKRLVKVNLASKLIVIAFIVVAGFLFAGTVQAATLYLEASSANVTVGDLVTVKLLVNTQSKAVNNAEAVIRFPVSLVEVVSVNYKSSIFSLWVEQPSFSNTNGQLSFNGGIPNPGYIGKSGEVLSAIFRAKKAGTASFLFGSAAVRENDGLGTDILTSQFPTSINITSVAQESQKPVIPSLLEPPIIYSPVYVDQNSWYSAKAGVITWTIPNDAAAVQTFFNNISDTIPSINYSPPIYQKEVKNLTDGTWYFHLRYSINSVWSKINHYRIQIDSQPPNSLTVTSVKNNDGTTSLDLNASDLLSGVDYYNIVIDDQSAIKVLVKDAEKPVLLPRLSIGEHQISVSVYDKAGNKRDLVTQITVDSLTAPVIDNYTKEVKIGGIITASGSSIYPEASIKFIVKPEFGDEAGYNLVTDKNGNFSFASAPMNLPGNYQIWAYIPGPDGSVGAMSEKQNLVVKQSIWDVIKEKLLSLRIPYSRDIVFTITLLIVALIGLIGWYRYLVLRRRLRLLEKKTNHAFMLLVKRARKKISVLDKSRKARGSNPEEKNVINNLKEILEEIENIKKGEMK